MISPLLKWPGGKRWLAHKIVPYLSGTFKRYIEPFLGGGAILFALEPSKAFASDINYDLICCYQSIKNDGNKVLNEICKFRGTKDEYYRIRDCCDLQSEFERAARFIYLLRHSWNGLYRVNKQGQFNVPYCPRERKDKITEEMMSSFQRILQRVTLTNQDFSSSIAEAMDGDLIFADPPYFQNGRKTFGRYNSITFRETQQEHLAIALTAAECRGAAWILTNGNLTQVQAHFPRHDIFRISRHSSIAADPRARGIIWEYIVLSNGGTLNELRRFLRTYYEEAPT
jgi:DNA adenine methylase